MHIKVANLMRTTLDLPENCCANLNIAWDQITELQYQCLKKGIIIDENLIKGYLAGKQIINSKTSSFFDAFDKFIEAKRVD